MKRCWISALIAIVMMLTLTGCEEEVEKEKELEILSPLNGSTLEQSHSIEDFEFVTTYDTGDYNLSRWRITDSKVINMTAEVRNISDSVTVLVEHVHIDMSLKSTNPQLDGLSQDSMDDSYHGTSQDGFLVSNRYDYENKFAIEGFSSSLIDGWMFATGDFGTGNIDEIRLTEKNLINDGGVYANKMQVIYDVLIKYEGEEYFHTVSIVDEFLIPVESEIENLEKNVE